MAYDYAPYYCEENIWRLLARPEYADGENFALFILGREGRVGVFSQRTGRTGDGLVVWDYHVIALMLGPDRKAEIVDFDSSIGFPVAFSLYLDLSFSPFVDGLAYRSPFEPIFRLLPGREYVERFESDRSHMVAEDGSWLAPPPGWAAPSGASWPLERLLDPDRGTPGRLIDLDGLRRDLLDHA